MNERIPAGVVAEVKLRGRDLVIRFQDDRIVVVPWWLHGTVKFEVDDSGDNDGRAAVWMHSLRERAKVRLTSYSAMMAFDSGDAARADLRLISAAFMVEKDPEKPKRRPRWKLGRRGIAAVLALIVVGAGMFLWTPENAISTARLGGGGGATAEQPVGPTFDAVPPGKPMNAEDVLR